MTDSRVSVILEGSSPLEQTGQWSALGSPVWPLLSLKLEHGGVLLKAGLPGFWKVCVSSLCPCSGAAYLLCEEAHSVVP